MKLIKFITALVLICALLGGCSGGRNLNDMTVVQAVSLDEINGRVYLGIQYLDFNKGSGTNEGLNSSLTENAFAFGNSVSDAVNNLEKTLPDDYFTGQAKLMVVGKDFYLNRMDELKNRIVSDKRIRCDMFLATAEKYACDVLKNPFGNERVPIDGICKQLIRKRADVTVNDYLSDEKISLPEIVLKKRYGVINY